MSGTQYITLTVEEYGLLMRCRQMVAACTHITGPARTNYSDVRTIGDQADELEEALQTANL